MERTVMFGGFDFVGYHLCELLVNNGVEVIITDKQVQSKYQQERFDNVGRNALVQRIQDDIRDSVNIIDPIDCVYFVYGPYSRYDKKPDKKMIDYQMLELKKAVELANSKNAHVVLLSTNEQYDQKFDNDFHCLKGKLENGLEKLNNDNPISIIQTPYIYGPWSDEGCFIQKLITKKIDGKEILKEEILSEELIYIKDLVNILFEIGKSKNQRNFITYIPSLKNQTLDQIYHWMMNKKDKITEQWKDSLIEGLAETQRFIIKQRIIKSRLNQ